MPTRGVRLERLQESSDRRPSDDSLVEIDPGTGYVIQVVRLPDAGPVIVSGSSVWVASPRRSTVSRVDARSAKVVATTRLAATPAALARGPEGSVWVLVSGSSPAVVQLDARSGQIIKRFRLASCCPAPRALARTQAGTLWIAGPKGVLRIDPATGAQSIVARFRAVAIAPAPGGRVFASNGWDAVAPLPASAQATITFTGTGVGSQGAIQPTGLVYGDAKLWVVAQAKRAVLAIDQYGLDAGYSNLSAAIPVGREPADIAYGEGSLWVDNRRDGTISQIDPTHERVIRTIHLGYRPAGLAVGAGAVWASTRRVSATSSATGLLAFDDQGEIFTSRPDGTQRRQLTHTDTPLQSIQPAWSPDGRQIAFLRVRWGQDNGSAPYTPLALYVMNANGTGQHPIPNTADLFGGAPAWSPDGTTIAFDAGSPSHIYTIELDGSHRTRIAGGLADSADPAWSPDGTQIGFDANLHTSTGSVWEIHSMRSDGTELRRLAKVPSSYMQWSPDGRRIVFSRWRSDGTFLGEFVAPTSGGPGIRLLPPTQRYSGEPGPSVASWSPDGAALAVSGVVGAFPTQPAIYIANADGSGLTFVTRGNNATWRPVA